MSPSFKIILVGAGFAGLSAAIALAKKGHKVILLEALKEFQNSGGILVFGPNAFRVLEGYGVYEEFVDACSMKLEPSRLRRYNDSEIISETSPDVFEKLYGYRRIPFVRPTLLSILQRAALKEGVEMRFGCQVKEVDQAVPAVTLQDGTKLEADLIVAADGIRSTLSQQFIKDMPILQGGLDVCRILLTEEQVRSNPKISHLLHRNDIWMGPGKMVVATAMRAEASLVYGAELAYPASKTESERPPKRLDIGEVKKTFSDFDPIFQHVLSAAKDAWLWRLWQLPTDFSWVNEEGTIVVTGDAAHAMLPHAAMGGAMCLEDGASLAECIDRAATKADIPACLKAFETIRKPRTTLFSKTADEQSKLMVSKDPKEIENRDKLRKEKANLMPELWDGKAIDKVPDSWRDPMYAHWTYAHDVVDYTNRRLDDIFGPKSQS